MATSNSTKVFVGGIPKEVTKSDIYEKAASYGTVTNVYYSQANDASSGGWAFITFKEAEESRKAIEALHSKYIFPNSHRPLIVKFADPKQHNKDNNNKTTNNKDNKPTHNVDTKMKKQWLSTGITKPPICYYNGVKEQALQNRPQDAPMPHQFKENDFNFTHQEPMTSLFIFHLPTGWTDQDLYRHFRGFGYITNAYVQKDATGRNRGFGFVTYKSHIAALNAIKRMNGFQVSGKHLKVEFKKGDHKYLPMSHMVQNSMIKNSILQNAMLQNSMIQNTMLQSNMLQNNMLHSSMLQGNLIQNNLMSNGIMPPSPMIMNQPTVLPPVSPPMIINQQPPLSPVQPNFSPPYVYAYESMDIKNLAERNSFSLSRCEKVKKKNPTSKP